MPGCRRRVVGGLRDGLDEVVPGLEAAPVQGRPAQDFPPRLDEVEVGGVFRLDAVMGRPPDDRRKGGCPSE
jgi:hypothetical protein